MSNINPFIHEFTVDLRNGVTMERAKKPLSQGDAFANKIVVHVLKDGQTVPLDGVAVSASVIRYDGATVPLTGTVEEGAACIVLNDECYAVPGDLLVSVVLAVGEVKQTILRLMLNVETSQTDIIADGGVIGSFSQLLAEIENMRSATAAAISAAERAEAAADKAEGIAPGGGGTGTVTSVNGVEPDEEGNVQITIPEVPAWAMAATKPAYTAKEVGADPAGTASSAVSTHNADEDAHPAIRQLVDAIVVPTKLSELAGDATHRVVTDAEKTAWNAKSTFSGKYADLTGKPTIPSTPEELGALPADAEIVDKTARADVAKLSNCVTPQMFGAKGDGTTDDTAAMQAAFTDVAVNGKYLFIPKGRYKVTSPITIDWSSTSTTKRNFLQKIIGAGSQAFEKYYDNSVIVGYNIPANRGVIELIGNGNTWGTETRIEDLGIECDKASCDPMSFALKYGDARNFKLHRVKLRGHNAVLARCGSIVDSSGNSTTKGYEQINVKFEQCDFYTFDDNTKGFAFLPEGVITGQHATMDNIVVDSCCISGVWVIASVNIMFQSCQVYIPNIANKAITTDNVGKLNGYAVDYGTGFYVGQAMSAVFQNCYFEDHRRSFHITPTLGSIRNVSIMNCYMNPGSNQFNADGSRLNADYGVLITPGTSSGVVRNVLVQNNVFRLVDGDTEFAVASVRNECAEHFVFRDNCTTSSLAVTKVENTTTSGYDIQNGKDSGASVKSMTTSADGKTLTIELTNGKSTTFNTGASAPVKGVDYFTAAEVEEIKESAAALAKAELQQIPPPTWVESVDDMTDESKNYVLLETGNIWAYMTTRKSTEDVIVPAFTNLMDDPGAYIKDGYRYSQSSAEFKAQASDCSIVIPLSYIGACTLRVRGANIDGCAYPNAIYLGTTNEEFAQITQTSRVNSTDANGDLVITFTTSVAQNNGCKYCVFMVADGVDASNLIVTLNEEIKYTTQPGGTETVTGWTDTGHNIVQG